MSVRGVAACTVVVGAILFAGCAGEPVSPVSNEGAAHLQRLGALFRSYAGAAQGRTPANEKKFREFLAKQLLGGSVDDALTSPRDSQPYVVAYNKKLPNLGGSPTVIIYERSGVKGERLYLTSNLTVERASEEEFAALDVPKT